MESAKLELYVGADYVSAFAMSAFVALKEKQLSFELVRQIFPGRAGKIWGERNPDLCRLRRDDGRYRRARCEGLDRTRVSCGSFLNARCRTCKHVFHALKVSSPPQAIIAAERS